VKTLKKELTDKIIQLDSVFLAKKELPTADSPIESIYIEGYANTTDIDRSGDVIPTTAWEKGMDNYLKNPVILAYHDHDDPVGVMVDHKVDSKGLWIKARISAAASEVFNKVKDGILRTFSVSFIIKDAIYDSVTDIFVIKELELLEISVVSIPCNQNSTFSLAKSFASDEEAKEFKNQFISTETSVKKHETPKVDTKVKEWNMDPKELEALLATAVAKALDTQNAAVEKAAKEKADKEAKEKAEQDAISKKVEEQLALRIESGKTGAEKLLADIQKRADEMEANSKSIFEGLEASIKEKAAELALIQKSKMSFTDKGNADGVDYAEKELAVLAAKFSKKSLTGTQFGRNLVEKAGAHTNSDTWETEVSLNLENQIRRQLVIAPIFRSIDMKTNVMKLPSNPDAGYATWMANASFGTTASPGAAQTHALGEVTLSAYKVATREYLNFEEEEDSLIALTPIIRDAMVRRVAKAVDLAYVLGAGTGADPVKGVALYDATSAVTASASGVATMANMRALRKDLGVWGLNPSDFIYVVSTEVYYDLMEDTSFQSVLQVGEASATLLTGQVGFIGSTPVVVSANLSGRVAGSATSNTNVGAVAIAAGNWLAGNQRGLRMDTQDLVETQRTVLVASLRTGLVQLATSSGQGVSVLRWI
jgi:HK97 family phage prohead protease/HK97 family phage major capsid protein